MPSRQKGFLLPSGLYSVAKRVSKQGSTGSHYVFLPQWLLNNGKPDSTGWYWVIVRNVDPFTLEVRILSVDPEDDDRVLDTVTPEL